MHNSSLARSVIAGAALFLAGAASAAGGDASPPGQPGWSLGAGVTLFSVSTLSPVPTIGTVGSGGRILTLPTFASAPTVVASLERRISERSWLVLGVAGSLQRVRSDVTVLGAARADVRQGDALVGLRHVVTRSGAPVEVSLVVLGDVGAGRIEQAVDPGLFSRTQTIFVAGGSFGLAVERALLESLSVRVATTLAAVRWSRTRDDASGQAATAQTSTVTDLTAEVEVAPRLELRLAF